MVVVGVIGAAGTITSGLIGMGAAKKRERAAKDAKDRLGAELNRLESSRQAIINPYETTKDMSSLAKDLSGSLSNPYANLGVATNAAKFEAEQIDVSLANTLDTLKDTGAGAGGATALATAALKAKQGISASIESQEANNEKMRAQGEANLQLAKMEEKQRVQGVQLAEARRVQESEAQGKMFAFNAQETREQGRIDRVAGQLAGAEGQEMQAQADRTGALTGMIGGLSSIAGSVAAGRKSGDNTTTNNTTTNNSTAAPTASPSKGVRNKRYGWESDRRLKENIVKVGKSNSGLNIYNFEYKDKKFGEGIYQGVMSDEVPKESVIVGSDGYDRVNYSLLDVEFKKIK
jgi:hypothetical protein